MMKPVGIILAGGLARRLGGVDKGLIEIGGRPILARLIERLNPQCAALVLNANGDASRFAPFGLPVVADEIEGFAGPLAGVLAGMNHAAAHCPRVFDLLSVPVDTPFVPSDLAARLAETRAAAGAENRRRRLGGTRPPRRGALAGSARWGSPSSAGRGRAPRLGLHRAL